MLQAGASDRKSAAHTPVVATVTAEGAPSQRVMILREVDWDNRRLRFHTDVRSAKVGEADGAAASVLIYDPKAKIQLRIGGTCRVEQDGPIADAAWQSSTLFARRCYMAEESPGLVTDAPTSGLPPAIEGRQPSEADIAPARANFAVLIVTYDCIEWLYLANSGHRRARFTWEEGWQGNWLVP